MLFFDWPANIARKQAQFKFISACSVNMLTTYSPLSVSSGESLPNGVPMGKSDNFKLLSAKCCNCGNWSDNLVISVCIVHHFMSV